VGTINRWAMDREGTYFVYGKPLTDSRAGTSLPFAGLVLRATRRSIPTA
jgi:hypothetical protein